MQKSSEQDGPNGGRPRLDSAAYLRLAMLRGRTRGQIKTISEEDSDSKRTTVSRHGLIRAQAGEWLAREAEIKFDINSILSEQRRVKNGRRQALWKSWVYHISSPLSNALTMHLDKRCVYELSRKRRQLYQKYIDFSNNPLNVLALDYVNLKKYNPFVMRNSHCLKVVVPKLRDPLVMKWRERDEEKTFVQSSWPLTDETNMIDSTSESILTYSENLG